MKLPKHYRQQIYGYVETLLQRPLTQEEHDDLYDLMTEYVFSAQNLRGVARRLFCRHEWVSDLAVEGGSRARAFIKCRKCEKRTKKRLPVVPSI